MKCNEARKLVSESLDRELPEPVHAEVLRHVEGCKRCRVRFEDLSRLQAVLRSARRLTPPASLDAAVRSIWHPTLRPQLMFRIPSCLYGYLNWELGKLRLMGHLAGLLVTAMTLSFTLTEFGNFTLNYSKIAGPGVYTYMTRPSPHGPYYRNATDLIARQELYDSYLHTHPSINAARLNHHTLTKFAHDELRATHEDSFSVITSVNAGGKGIIRGVLHSPRDRKLFKRFGQLISTSEFNLAQPDGESGNEGNVVWSFSRIFVTS